MINYVLESPYLSGMDYWILVIIELLKQRKSNYNIVLEQSKKGTELRPLPGSAV